MTEAANTLSRTKILVVDDSRIVRATIRKHLADDYDLLDAADGEAGWQCLLADPAINLLISDLSMPELDGLGLLARVRSAESEAIRSLPVIIISGEEDEETRSKCVACGANDFITKSTDRVEMQARVRANLDLQAARRELDVAKTQVQTAAMDAVTGVGSEHLLNLQLDQFHAFTQRHGAPLSLTLIQLDRFDEVQAKLGERVAGQMLAMLAKLLQTKLRREDTFSHLQGPLFAVASPGASLEGTQILAERLRLTVQGARINFRGEQLHLTATIAVASTLHDKAQSAAEFYQHAYDRLRGSPGAGSLLLPDVALAAAPVPLLTEALAMLQRGEGEKLRPHVPALLATLLPLLELANDEMQLAWPLEHIRR